jgi:hypothetical protein
LSWSATILLHSLHLHHRIVLLMLSTQSGMLVLRDVRNSWRLPRSDWLIVNLLVSVSVQSGVSSLSDVGSFYLEISRDLEISWASSTVGALREGDILWRVRLVNDWIDNTTATAWALTWIIKEDYFCKRGTTESEGMGVSAERAHPARSLRRLLFCKRSKTWLFLVLVLVKWTKAVPRTHQSCATEVTIYRKFRCQFNSYIQVNCVVTYRESLFVGDPRNSAFCSTNLRASVFSLKTRCCQARWSEA